MQSFTLCNCLNKTQCKVKDKCIHNEVVYKSTITTNGKTYEYIGSTVLQLKRRIANHEYTFKSADL